MAFRCTTKAPVNTFRLRQLRFDAHEIISIHFCDTDQVRQRMKRGAVVEVGCKAVCTIIGVS